MNGNVLIETFAVRVTRTAPDVIRVTVRRYVPAIVISPIWTVAFLALTAMLVIPLPKAVTSVLNTPIEDWEFGIGLLFVVYILSIPAFLFCTISSFLGALEQVFGRRFAFDRSSERGTFRCVPFLGCEFAFSDVQHIVLMWDKDWWYPRHFIGRLCLDVSGKRRYLRIVNSICHRDLGGSKRAIQDLEPIARVLSEFLEAPIMYTDYKNGSASWL